MHPRVLNLIIPLKIEKKASTFAEKRLLLRILEYIEDLICNRFAYQNAKESMRGADH